MAKVRDRQAVLMSIHPKFANLIMAGKKQVEFRKGAFARPVRYVLVYSTSPVKRVIGYFTVKGFDRRAVHSLWSRHRSGGGITKSEFMEYFRGSKDGVAIEIEEAVRFDKPVGLSALGSGFRAPQSFSYLDEEQAAELIV